MVAVRGFRSPIETARTIASEERGEDNDRFPDLIEPLKAARTDDEAERLLIPLIEAAESISDLEPVKQAALVNWLELLIRPSWDRVGPRAV